jgi:hypothetical protein
MIIEIIFKESNDCSKVFETPENLSITIAALFAIFRLKIV